MRATGAFAVWCLFGVFAGVGAGRDDRPSGPEPRAPEVRGEGGLAHFQRDIARHADRCQVATVGVESPDRPGSGSGVIVSKDGLVLTAGHCVPEAGAAMRVVLSDGRTLKAKALGAEWDADAAMVQITEPGPWPYVDLAKSAPAKGDPCLAFGHPGGVQWDRKPVLRLGQVGGRVRGDQKGFDSTSSCRLVPGDSGGPLFNVQGELIGIHGAISSSVTLSNGKPDERVGQAMHNSMEVFRKHWDFMLAGKSVGKNKASGPLPSAKGGRAGGGPAKGGEGEQGKPLTLEGLKKKWALDDQVVKEVKRQVESQLEGLRKKLPEKVFQPEKAFQQVLQQIDRHLQKGGTIEDLPPIELQLDLELERATGLSSEPRGRTPLPEKVSAEARRTAKAVEACVVEILKGKTRVGYGTVVGDGLIVAKASELPEPVVCRFGGTAATAVIAARSEANDLALLKVELPGTKPVTWGKDAELGQVLVSRTDKADALGVVAHQARRLPNEDQARKEGLASPLDEREARRRRETLDVVNSVFGVTPSKRRDGFPWAFSHDLDLRADETGVPLLNVRGEVVGVHIACEGVATNLALPARVVRNLLSQWEAANFPDLQKEFLTKYRAAKDTDAKSRLLDEYGPRFLALAEGAKGTEAAAPVSFLLQVGLVRQKPELHKKLTDLVRAQIKAPGIADYFAVLSGLPDETNVAILREVLDANPDQVIRAKAARALVRANTTLDQMAKLLAAGVGGAQFVELGTAYVKYLEDNAKAFPERASEFKELLAVKFKDVLAMPVVGRPAPELVSKDLDGKEVKLSAYKGKVVVVDIWATWCGPCRAMIPHERELVKRVKDKQFALISVSADDSVETLKNFLKDNEMPWTHWFSGRGTLIEDWDVQGFPTIYVIDHKGVIRFTGVRDKKMDEAVDQLIKEMEDEKKNGK